MIEVLDVIYRMTEVKFLTSNIPRAPRQIDIVGRLMTEKPNEWESENSLRVIVHRRVKELLAEGLIDENAKRYTLTHKGKISRSDNIDRIRTNYKRNWGEVKKPVGLHASYGFNSSYLIVDRNRENSIKDKISNFLNSTRRYT
jgi:hypothetical protein